MPSPSFAIIIPARYESSRYPGKPLAALKGATGQSKSLIERSWECASSVPDCVGVWVATDDERVASEVRRFGGEVVMTSTHCRNGTERCAEAAATLGEVAEVIVNLQGDAPLSPSTVVHRMVARVGEDPAIAMATPAVRCSPTVYRHLLDDARAGRVGGTTAVFSRDLRALYFSKRILPYVSDGEIAGGTIPVYLHLGMYAYRLEALAAYHASPVAQLEELEGLEQLRFLDAGLPVSIVPLEELDWDSIELNNPTDVPAIERVLAQRGIE